MMGTQQMETDVREIVWLLKQDSHVLEEFIITLEASLLPQFAQPLAVMAK